MSSTYLAYKIDGKSHENHQLSAEQLIASIRGFVDSVNETHKIMHGDSVTLPTINVVAFKPGSFEAIFEVIQNTVENFDTLSVLGFTAAPAIAHGIKQSVIDALKTINGRSFEVSYKRKEGVAEIKLDTGETFTTTRDVGVSLRNPKIRGGIDSIFSAPIENSGTEIVSLSLYDPEAEAIETDSQNIVVKLQDIPAFQANPIAMEDEVSTETFSKVVSFQRVNFEGAVGWKMLMPDKKKVAVKLKDEAFLTKVKGLAENQVQAFRSDDLFEVTIEKTTVTNKYSKKKSESYAVIQVLKQITDKGNRD